MHREVSNPAKRLLDSFYLLSAAFLLGVSTESCTAVVEFAVEFALTEAVCSVQWAIWIEQCADKDLVTHRSEPCQVFWSHLSRLQTVHRNLQRLFVALITHWQKCWPQVEIYFAVVDNDLQTKNAFPPRFYGLCLAEYGEETVCRRDRIPGENYWKKNYLALKTWKQLHWKPLNALKIQLLSVVQTLWQTSTQGGHFSFPQCETQTTYQMYCFSYYMHSVFLWLSRLYLLWVPTLNWNLFSFPRIILNCFIQNLNIHTPINWVSRIELHSK